MNVTAAIDAITSSVTVAQREAVTAIHDKAAAGAQTCPTCLSFGGAPLAGDPAASELATCPTCGVASVEWTLAAQIDEVVTELRGLHKLADALDEDSGS